MVKIVFEDDSLIVFDKSAGLTVTSDETQKTVTLEDILRTDFKIPLDRGGIVHRLDKDTSGLLVVAKTQIALENLQAQFKNRTIKKEYLTLVHGQVKKGGVIEAPIIRNPGDREKFTIALPGESINAKVAVTEYQPLGLKVMSDEIIQEIFSGFNKIQFRKLYTIGYPFFTLLKCQPQTGRTHQIRVHLKHTGFPIVADGKYGGRKVVRLDKRWCPRQFLHAARLELDHPENDKKMIFESKLPEDLQKALDLLK